MTRLAESDTLPAMLTRKMAQLALLSSSFQETIRGRFDDASDEETRLAKTLATHPYFQDAVIVIDGFWDFTSPQEQLISRFFRQAKEVMISFVVQRGETALFSLPLRSARRLLRLAGEADCRVKNVVLEEPAEHTPLSFLKNHLMHTGKVFDGAPDGITLTACKDAFDQADAIARDVVRLLQNGAQMRQIAILSRGAENDECLAMALEERGVSTFWEQKRALEKTPVAKTVLLGAAIALRDRREETVRAYLQSAVFACPEEERFLLEEYTAPWRISGEVLLSDKALEQNPEGYGALTARAEKMLEKINRAKTRVFAPLRRLSVGLSAGTNEEKIMALVAFLQEAGTEKLLLDWIESYKEAGDFEEAGALLRTWNTVLERLSALARTLGAQTSTNEHFLDLLRIAFSGALPGAVPPGQDRVFLGQVGFARPEGIRHVLLADLNAGVFPRADRTDTILTLSEREALAYLGYTIDASSTSGDRETFLFYLTCALAKDSLSLYYRGAENGSADNSAMSLFARRVLALFPALETRHSGDLALPQTASDAFSYYASLPVGDPCKEELASFYRDDPDWTQKALTLQSGRAFLQKTPFLQEEKPYRGRDVNMTYSRMNTYLSCPYSYFARYRLDLKESGRAQFASNLVGSFVHRVMELVLAHFAAAHLSPGEVDDKELAEVNRDACRTALKDIVGIADESATFLARQMEKNTLAILKNLKAEFSVSGFAPVFFEKDLTDLGDGYRLELEDGTHLVLYGSIDRVDLYQAKDGTSYVRVVDYKTGGHEFSLDGVGNGTDLQLLIYLFALWDGGFLWEGEKLSLAPAGILYLNGMADTPLCETKEEYLRESKKDYPPLERRGLLVNEPFLLAAQDPQASGEFLPEKKLVLLSREKLEHLKKAVEKNFLAIARRLKDGDIEPLPLRDPSGRTDACKYCPYHALCRNHPKHFRPWKTDAAKALLEPEPAKEETL